MSRFLSLFFFLAVFSSPSIARPTIGLVLSGGGARGAAHVGVLKVLEELKIPIDVVIGTSMGSIVGGLYASGRTPAEIEETINAMDWDYMLADDQSRADVSLNRKVQQDLFSLSFSPGIREGKLRLPPGAIQGQKIELELQRLTTHVAHITDFDKLPIPFRAVATDIETGNMVVLSSGNLGRAMRASMSVPSLFAPIEIDGHLLVDGGIANNLPVDVARDMGAEVLIVVDIGSPLRTRDQMPDLLTITDQLTRLLTGRNVLASRAKLSEDDIIILPVLGDITSAQFDRSAEAISIGEIAARKIAGRLRHLSLSDQEYDEYLASLNTVSPVRREVTGINLTNKTTLADEVLLNRIDIKTGEVLNLSQLEKDIGQIHGIGIFEKVGYDLSHHPRGVDVDVYATPKSWGPNYLHFGLSMEGEFDSENDTNFVLGYTRTEMNRLGGEWTTLLQIGSEPRILSYFYQPLTKNMGYFVLPAIAVTRTNVGIFSGDTKLEEYRLHENQIELLFGKEFSTRANLGFGINRINGKADALISESSQFEQNYDDGGTIIRYRYDTIDDIDFPSSGGEISASYYQATEALGADTEYKQWRLKADVFKSFGHHTFGVGTELGGTEDGVASLSRKFFLGGFLNMSGLRQDQLSGDYKGLLGAVYYRKFDRIKLLPAYIGGTAEYGGVWRDKDDISAKNSLLGGSLFVGLDSPLGPVLVGWGYTDEGDSVFFAKIGRFFY